MANTDPTPLRPGIAAMLRDIKEMDASLSPEERNAPRSDGAKRYKDILYGPAASEERGMAGQSQETGADGIE